MEKGLPVLPIAQNQNQEATSTSSENAENTILKKISEMVTSAISSEFIPVLHEFCNNNNGPYSHEQFMDVLKLKPKSNVSLPNGMPGLPTALKGTGSAPMSSRKKKNKTDSRKCIYKFTRGEKGGQPCNKSCVAKSDIQMCNTHSKTKAGEAQWKNHLAQNGGAVTNTGPEAPSPPDSVNSAPPPASNESNQIQVNQDTDGKLVTTDGYIVEAGARNGIVFAVGKRDKMGDPSTDRPLNDQEMKIATSRGFRLKVTSPVTNSLPSIPGVD